MRVLRLTWVVVTRAASGRLAVTFDKCAGSWWVRRPSGWCWSCARASLADPRQCTANWGSEVLFRLIVGVGALAAGVLARVAPSATIRPAAVAEWIGLVLFWGGISLRLWSFHTLGRYFTFTVQTSSDQPVIADGPYRLIRHPELCRAAPHHHGCGPVHRELVVARVPHRRHDGRARVPHPSGGAGTDAEPR